MYWNRRSHTEQTMLACNIQYTSFYFFVMIDISLDFPLKSPIEHIPTHSGNATVLTHEQNYVCQNRLRLSPGD